MMAVDAGAIGRDLALWNTLHYAVDVAIVVGRSVVLVIFDVRASGH